MDDNSFAQVPFLTREMLKFGREAKLELKITTIADVASKVSIRGFSRSGIINFDHTSAATSAATSTQVRIDDIPTMISIAPVSVSTDQGGIWVSLSLLVNGDLVFPMVSGFATFSKGMSWPNSQLNDPRPGGGLVTYKSFTDPAAGANLNTALTAGEILHILYGGMTLTTSAAAANRRVHLELTASGVGTFSAFGLVDQVASTARLYVFSPVGAIPDEEDQSRIIIPIPPTLYTTASMSIQTSITNLQAADQITDFWLVVEKHFRGR